MNKQELIQRSIDIVMDYYDNKLEPFFDVITDDVLWLGPRGGQMLRGKKTIIAVWSAAKTDLKFTMGNIEAETASCGANNLEVLLEYYVYTHFPDGQMDRHHQRLHYSWGYEKADGVKVPKVYMIHLSNMAEEEPVHDAYDAGAAAREDTVTSASKKLAETNGKTGFQNTMETAGKTRAVGIPGTDREAGITQKVDAEEKTGRTGASAAGKAYAASPIKVYATSPAESHLDARSLPVFSRIHFRTAMGKGMEETTYFFNSRTILWIESTRGSNHSIVHTTEGNYESIEKLRYFEEQFGDALLRIHASFLINPLYLRSIKRFSVTLTDGTELPVPEKKYTDVRKRILAWNWDKN